MRVLMLITIAIALVAVASLPGTMAHEELDLRVTLGTVQTNETEVYQGDTVDFYIWVFNENASGLTQDYHISAHSELADLSNSLSNSSLTVEYRSEEGVRFRFTPSLVVEIDTYVFRVRVESSESANVTESVQMTMNVLKRPDEGITVELDRSRVTLETGQTEIVLVNITNLYDSEREIVVITFSSHNLTDASIDREHTIGDGETLFLLMYIYGGDPGDAVISIHIVPTSTPEFTEVRYVNVTVVEDLGAKDRREDSSPSSPSFDAIWGFTIGCLIAMFATMAILRNRFQRH